MNRRTIAVTLACLAAFLVLFPVLTFLFIPGEKIEAALRSSLRRQGYAFGTDRVRKAFPLGIRLVKPRLSDERGPLLSLDEAWAEIEPLPLFAGRVVIRCGARVGKGEGEAELVPGSDILSFHVAGVELADVPWFKVFTNADLKGTLSADGTFSGSGAGAEGEARVEVKGADFRGMRIGEVSLPDVYCRTVRGLYHLRGATGAIESLAFQGEGIHVRLRGRVAAAGPPDSSLLDLTLELMPKPDFIDRQQLVFLALAPYRTSPGAYRIPIGGTLGKPTVSSR